jgi:hypothetical protein
MKALNTFPLGFTCALALAGGAVYAQVPSTNDSSDTNGNTGMGTGALGGPAATSGGAYNTAVGFQALLFGTTGNSNTATGVHTLTFNTTGSNNTATGVDALSSNTTGNSNTASGVFALTRNTTGSDNTASGVEALFLNTTGSQNTAFGVESLDNNTTGDNNTGFGYLALYSNTVGKGNSAQGVNALYNNTTGIRNLGIGNNALYANSTGSYNIALGFEAGYNVLNGSNNIEIGASGNAADDSTIQIGVQGTQTSTTIAGIYGTPVTGSAVYVSSTGQLGVLGSSERFKTDIAPMPELSDKIGQLRPVTFRYKTDPKRLQQYGLIAEEVAKVYPELVIRDEMGTIQGVRYEELAPMLLHETQKQQRINAMQAERAERQDAEIRDLKQRVAKVNELEHGLAEMRMALAALRSKDHLVAQR